MSKIDEIRKRAEWTNDGVEAGPYSRVARADDPEFRMHRRSAIDAIADRLDLLVSLDGEWQSERPESGDWWLSIHPSNRDGCKRLVYEVTVLGSGEVVMRTGLTHLLFEEIFIGALWQRRTVPRDPFKKEAKQAARIEAARWREFCDSWVAIGRRAGAEHRRLLGLQTAEERRQDMARARLGMVLAMAAAIGSPIPRL